MLSKVVEEAREWVGTPFVFRQAQKGVGTDCVGLIFGVGMRLDLLPHVIPSYGPKPLEPIERSLEGFGFVRVSTPVPGMVGVFWIRRKTESRHLGIFTHTGLVHTSYTKGVFESSASWEKRLNAVFAYPGVLNG